MILKLKCLITLFNFEILLKKATIQFRKVAPYRPSLDSQETSPLLQSEHQSHSHSQSQPQSHSQLPSQSQSQSQLQQNKQKPQILDTRYMSSVTIHDENKFMEENENKIESIRDELKTVNEMFSDLDLIINDQQ